MKKKLRFSDYCGLALEWGVKLLEAAYYLLKILGEVTNYSAQSLRSSLRA
jgi:hypothetical protein